MQQPENGDDQNLMDEVHDDQAPSRRVYDLQTLRAIGKKVFLQRKPCPEEISRHYRWAVLHACLCLFALARASAPCP
jgi:hypothetical protein